MQSGARGGREEERRDTAGEKSIVNATRKTRGAKNEPGRTIKGDGRGNGREGGGGDGLRSFCWVRATIVSGTTLPSSRSAPGQPAGRAWRIILNLVCKVGRRRRHRQTTTF